MNSTEFLEPLEQSYVPYGVLEEKKRLLEEKLGTKLSVMKIIRSKFQTLSPEDSANIDMGSIVQKAEARYTHLTNRLDEVMNGYNSDVEIWVPFSLRYCLMTPNQDFTMDFWLPFLKVYKKFLDNKYIEIDNLVNKTYDKFTSYDKYEANNEFLNAFDGALEGISAINRLLTFDFDDAKRVPSYDIIRYVVTHIFRYLKQMWRFRKLGKKINLDQSAVKRRLDDNEFRKTMNRLGTEIFNLPDNKGIRLGVGELGEYYELKLAPKEKARPIKKQYSVLRKPGFISNIPQKNYKANIQRQIVSFSPTDSSIPKPKFTIEPILPEPAIGKQKSRTDKIRKIRAPIIRLTNAHEMATKLRMEKEAEKAKPEPIILRTTYRKGSPDRRVKIRPTRAHLLSSKMRLDQNKNDRAFISATQQRKAKEAKMKRTEFSRILPHRQHEVRPTGLQIFPTKIKLDLNSTDSVRSPRKKMLDSASYENPKSRFGFSFRQPR